METFKEYKMRKFYNVKTVGKEDEVWINLEKVSVMRRKNTSLYFDVGKGTYVRTFETVKQCEKAIDDFNTSQVLRVFRDKDIFNGYKQDEKDKHLLENEMKERQEREKERHPT